MLLREADKAAGSKLAMPVSGSDPGSGIAMQGWCTAMVLVVCQNGQAGMHIVMAARYAMLPCGLTGYGS